MRVVIAPDKFAGTLTAVEAAEAIATGWARRAPHDRLVKVPMSDGGPGFVDVLHAAIGGDLLALTTTDPYGALVPAAVLRVGETAYLESAHAVGLHLREPDRRDPEHASSAGLGTLIAAAIDAGVRRVVVGLGGSGTNDGGAGLLAALGATCTGASLTAGPAGLAGIGSLDLTQAVERVTGVDLVIATDVDSQLTGLFGATKTFGPQKGVAEDRLPVVDGWLQELAQVADRKQAAAKGAGAAGGIGFAMLLLGATREPGIGLVADAVGLAERLADADLVLTGEGAFDFSSRSGKVPYGVAEYAARAMLPCVSLAGRVDVGAREMRAMGIEAAYSMSELFGADAALAHPADTLAALAQRVARTWSVEDAGSAPE